jgi:hypothetical protein
MGQTSGTTKTSVTSPKRYNRYLSEDANYEERLADSLEAYLNGPKKEARSSRDNTTRFDNY